MEPAEPDDEPESEAPSTRRVDWDDSLVDDSQWEQNELSLTEMAPSFAAPEPKPKRATVSREIEILETGARIDDFEIESILGRGAFGCVYLARQMSLNRMVALKVTTNEGQEGRTMAQLEHENIVQVFSESVTHNGTRRLLCMQYVPGTTLEAVIRKMHGEPARPWSGDSILNLIDEIHPDPPPIHPAAMRHRYELGNADSIEAVCWIGNQLAEALAYAHHKGVLHRDIKPANILQTRAGQPLLADFNLAFQSVDVRRGRDSLFGGTLSYMSPEHLDAFHPDRPTRRDAVDQRSDIYSLGVVLHELAYGDVALPEVAKSADNLEKLETISEARRNGPSEPSSESRSEDAPEVGEGLANRLFGHTVRRCMRPDPADRFQNADELAKSLSGCKTLSEIEKDLPRAGIVTRSAIRHPFWWLVLLAILPHLPIGSTVNISYNAFRIVGHLSPAQRDTFENLVLFYNGTLYPIVFLALVFLLRPVYRVFKTLRQDVESVDAAEVAEARRFCLRWPRWAVTLGCLGWIPCGLFFPIALRVTTGPIEPWVYVHFVISCTLSGLIAMSYSYFGIQFLVTRVFYPNLWCDVSDLAGTAQEELGDISPSLRVFQTLSGFVPLAGAILVVALGPEDGSTQGAFQFLTITLIVLGLCGFQLANHGGALILETVDAMTKRRGTRQRVGDVEKSQEV